MAIRTKLSRSQFTVIGCMLAHGDILECKRYKEWNRSIAALLKSKCIANSTDGFVKLTEKGRAAYRNASL
jgi:hypothetical protein